MQLPAGITGLSRVRRWDATWLVDLPALDAAGVEELELLVLEDGSLVGAEGVGDEAAQALAAVVAGSVDRPYAVNATRRPDNRWAVGARSLDVEIVALSASISAGSLEVVAAPDGEVTSSVDGEPVETPLPELAVALHEIEERGRARFESFVARADRVGDGRWALTVNPL